MNARFAVLLFALAIISAISLQAAAAPRGGRGGETGDSPVTLAKVPVAARDKITSLAGKNTIGNILRHSDDEGVDFAVEITSTDGAHHDLVITNTGDLLSQEVALAETPAAVQATIKFHTGSNKVAEIDKQLDEVEHTFLVTLTTAKGDTSFTVGENGTLESQDITLNEAPYSLVARLKEQPATDKVKTIEKVFDAGEVSYDVTVTNKDGVDRDFSFDADGNLDSMEIALTDAPKAVQTTIATTLARNTLISVDEDIDPGGNIYDVVMRPANGRERSFSVSADGSLLTEEVFLEQVPVAARNTITAQVGNGKIIEIDKSYVLDTGVKPFEVHAWKDGKEVDFSVGPGGKFLGLDN